MTQYFRNLKNTKNIGYINILWPVNYSKNYDINIQNIEMSISKSTNKQYYKYKDNLIYIKKCMQIQLFNTNNWYYWHSCKIN